MPKCGIKPRWKKGESGNPAGRARKYVSTLKGIGYKLSEINDTLQNMIASTQDELRAFEKDPNCTILERIVAGALLESQKKKSMFNIETLLTRVYGKPAEKKNDPADDKYNEFRQLTADERLDRIRQLTNCEKIAGNERGTADGTALSSDDSA